MILICIFFKTLNIRGEEGGLNFAKGKMNKRLLIKKEKKTTRENGRRGVYSKVGPQERIIQRLLNNNN